MRQTLRTLHRYGGALVALYFGIIAASGAVLVVRADVLSAVYGEALRGDTASIVSAIAAQYDGGFRAIAFPSSEAGATQGAYTVYLPGHRTALHSAYDGAAIPDRFGLVRGFDLVFDLHHYLLADDLGMEIAGYFGIAAIALLVTGPILWWPWRRGFSIKRLWPTSSKPALLLGAHVSLGIVLAPLLLLSTATGVSMIFNAPVKAALIGVFGGGAKTSPAPEVAAKGRAARGDGLNSAIAALKAAYPSSVARMYVPPRKGQTTARLRFKQRAQWNPNGRSYLHFDTQSGEITGLTDSLKGGRGEAIYNALYPLHAGKIGSRLYQALIACLGLGGVLLPYWGLRGFLKRRRFTQ